MARSFVKPALIALSLVSALMVHPDVGFTGPSLAQSAGGKGGGGGGGAGGSASGGDDASVYSVQKPQRLAVYTHGQQPPPRRHPPRRIGHGIEQTCGGALLPAYDGDGLPIVICDLRR